MEDSKECHQRLAENMKGMSLGTAMVSNKTRSATGSNGMGPTPVRRNKSGPHGHRMMRSRAPPKRTQSQKIGRPAFDPDIPDASAAVDQKNLHKRQQPKRGVNRSQSNRARTTARNVPPRSGSFQRRRVPDRTSSSSSLRRVSTKRQQQQQQHKLNNAMMTTGSVETDDVSVSDSVYTSLSIQTMDSIMVRKKQMPSTQGKNGGSRIEFEENVYYDDGDMYEYEDELSIFSESWCSSESGHSVISDYEEEEMDGAIQEDEVAIQSSESEDECKE